MRPLQLLRAAARYHLRGGGHERCGAQDLTSGDGAGGGDFFCEGGDVALCMFVPFFFVLFLIFLISWERGGFFFWANEEYGRGNSGIVISSIWRYGSRRGWRLVRGVRCGGIGLWRGSGGECLRRGIWGGW